MAGKEIGREEMIYTPILFQADMIRALRANLKTQTRRTRGLEEINEEPDYWRLDDVWMDLATFFGKRAEIRVVRCPYGGPGDRLWTRETITRSGGYIQYAADHQTSRLLWPAHWKRDCRPSIHMPRVTSRDTLEIIELRCQRVQEITEEDAIAEGVGFGFQMNGGWPDYQHINKRGVCTLTQDTAEMSYATLWDSINGKRPGYSWKDNPRVWAITYRRVI
jgi:hypothetical protein